MSGRIPKTFIDDLLNRVDIVDVIDARVPLKKKGGNYTACCPFHNEKTPSFTVSPNKQFYHCFGCGAHGTAVTFLMEYDRLPFPEAIESLAQHVGVEVPREENTGHAVQKNYSEIYAALKQASDFYSKQLKQSTQAIEYLKQRGLSGTTAAKYGLGYAPDAWDKTYNLLNQQTVALEAGLVIRKDNGQAYDRFRNRIMFPIRDARGRVCGFGGRTLTDDIPKYINSPETSVFHKGKNLYGVYELRGQSKTDPLLVVEGYMDVVMLFEHGIQNVVATLGTATTSDQITALFKLSFEIIFCFDGDNAGQQAAWKALDTAMGMLDDRHKIKFLFLPEKEDPDSMVRKEGKEAFFARIDSATPLSRYFFEQLEKKHDVQSLDERALLAEAAKPYIEKMRESTLKQLLINELAQKVGLPENKLFTSSEPSPKQTVVRAAVKAQKNVLIRKTVALLLNDPKLALSTKIDINALRNLQKPGVELLLEIITLIREKPDISTPAILQRYADTKYSDALSRLALEETPNPEKDENLLATIFQSAWEKLIADANEQYYATLLQKPPRDLSEAERQALQNFRRT